MEQFVLDQDIGIWRFVGCDDDLVAECPKRRSEPPVEEVPPRFGSVLKGDLESDPERTGHGAAAYPGAAHDRYAPAMFLDLHARLSRLLSPLAVVLAVAASACRAEPTVPDATLVVTGVTVLPLDGGRQSDRTVFVTGDRIVAVMPASKAVVPESAVVVDGSGRFLIPGLVEMHGHLPGGNAPPWLAEDILMLYLANGVTTVRGMQGHESQIALRDRIAAGELAGPRLIVGSPAMSGRVASPDEGDALVREYAEAGFDLIKVHEGIAPEVFEAIASAAGETGLAFAGHIADEVGLHAALAAGQDTVDHLDNFVEELLPEGVRREVEALRGIADHVEAVEMERLPDLIERVAGARGVVVPTMVLWESGIFPTRPSSALLMERPETRYMPGETVRSWIRAVDSGFERYGTDATHRLAEIRREVFRALHAGSIRMLLGTDSPQIFSVPGFAIHREMASYVEAGMTPEEVLLSGTLHVSAHLAKSGFEDDFGVIAPGKRADLILLGSDPTEDIGATRDIAGVAYAGNWLSRNHIEEALAGIAARRAAEE